MEYAHQSRTLISSLALEDGTLEAHTGNPAWVQKVSEAVCDLARLQNWSKLTQLISRWPDAVLVNYEARSGQSFRVPVWSSFPAPGDKSAPALLQIAFDQCAPGHLLYDRMWSSAQAPQGDLVRIAALHASADEGALFRHVARAGKAAGHPALPQDVPMPQRIHESRNETRPGALSMFLWQCAMAWSDETGCTNHSLLWLEQTRSLSNLLEHRRDEILPRMDQLIGQLALHPPQTESGDRLLFRAVSLACQVYGPAQSLPPLQRDTYLARVMQLALQARELAPLQMLWQNYPPPHLPAPKDCMNPNVQMSPHLKQISQSGTWMVSEAGRALLEHAQQHPESQDTGSSIPTALRRR